MIALMKYNYNPATASMIFYSITTLSEMDDDLFFSGIPLFLFHLDKLTAQIITPTNNHLAARSRYRQ